jgi:hypothetical protein
LIKGQLLNSFSDYLALLTSSTILRTLSIGGVQDGGNRHKVKKPEPSFPAAFMILLLPASVGLLPPKCRILSVDVGGEQAEVEKGMNWIKLVAYVTGTVDQELLRRHEDLVTENRILRKQTKGHMPLSNGARKPLAEIGKRLGEAGAGGGVYGCQARHYARLVPHARGPAV